MSIVVPPLNDVWQGDLFTDAPWGYVRDLVWLSPDDQRVYRPVTPPSVESRGHVAIRGGRGMVALITHECVFDKGYAAPSAFARVLPLGRQSERMQGEIKNGRWPAAFHLPGTPGVLREDLYIDFRLLVCLDARLITKLTKHASLSDDGRDALRGQLIRYWTRSDLLV